jgi:hypothetical protein
MSIVRLLSLDSSTWGELARLYPANASAQRDECWIHGTPNTTRSTPAIAANQMRKRRFRFGFGAESGDDVTFSVVGLSDASGERDGEVSGCALEGCVSMLT